MKLATYFHQCYGLKWMELFLHVSLKDFIQQLSTMTIPHSLIVSNVWELVLFLFVRHSCSILVVT